MDANLREEFETTGIVTIKGFLSEGILQDLRDAVDCEIAAHDPRNFKFEGNSPGKFTGSQDMWRRSAACRSFCLDSRLSAIVGHLIYSSRVNLFFDHLFVKEPGTDLETSWHTDTPYWPISGSKIVSCWVSLDRATTETGALTFLRGSHKWDANFQPEFFAESEISGRSQRQLQEYLATLGISDLNSHLFTAEAEAGDVVIFDARIVHKAGANRSPDQVRRGYVVRYAGDDVVYQPRPGVHKMMLDSSLTPGSPITSDRFPVVWTS